MLTTDDIFLLACALRDSPSVARRARDELLALAATPDYQAWYSSTLQSRPYTPSPLDDVRTLAQIGMVRDGYLLVRANSQFDRAFVTDGVWVNPAFRAFPFNDESVVLVGAARALGWDVEADAVLDLAGGCGHSAFSFDAALQQMYDINPRALAYADVNRQLNGLDGARYRTALNDIRAGVGVPIPHGAKNVLVLANMPFGPAPRNSNVPLTSDGGRAGVDLQVATFTALQELRDELPSDVTLRALVMGMSVGCAATQSWDLLERARAQFGDSVKAWQPLEEEALLRIDGRRVAQNPSPISEALPTLADCWLYFPEPSARAERKAAFAVLAAEHESQGNPDLAFGIVEMEIA